jgi:transcriptional regulator with XRE-family HTH domain
VLARLISELVDARKTAGVSQQALARVLGWSQSAVSRFERMLRPDQISFVEVAQVASALGLAFGGSLYPLGDPLRDKGHQALIRRFRAILSAAWRVAVEVPLPNLGDPRAWDLLLRLGDSVVGVEAETRLRDLQAFVRRIRQRERDGGVDAIVIVLCESAVNRRLLAQLLEALGPDYATPPRVILGALRKGEPLAGSGVVLI